MTPKLTPDGAHRQVLRHRSAHQESYDAGIDIRGSSVPTTIRKQGLIYDGATGDTLQMNYSPRSHYELNTGATRISVRTITIQIP